MKKFLIYALLCFCSLPLPAQNRYEEIAGKFFRFYNLQAADSIFLLYSPELQEKLPLEKTTAVISGLHIQYGDLKSLGLMKQDSGFNMYKAVFAHQTMSLLIALNSEDLLDGFRLVPYIQEPFPKEKNKNN
jgi:hypothetical protein